MNESPALIIDVHLGNEYYPVKHSKLYSEKKSCLKLLPTPHRPSTPRWVKVFVIIFLALVLLVVILHLMGIDFGGHGISGNILRLEHAVQQL